MNVNCCRPETTSKIYIFSHPRLSFPSHFICYQVYDRADMIFIDKYWYVFNGSIIVLIVANCKKYG